MIIKQGKLVLKSPSEEDEETRRLSAESEDLENMSERRMYPPGIPTEMIFRITHEGKFAGEIRLTRIRWFNRKSELSIILKKEFQGKGIGTEAMKTLINFAFDKMNLYRLEAEVLEFNTASIKLVEKLGFSKEGTLRKAKYARGKYWDIFRYGLLREEWEKSK